MTQLISTKDFRLYSASLSLKVLLTLYLGSLFLGLGLGMMELASFTHLTPQGAEEYVLGAEEKMVFPKTPGELLTTTHDHLLGLGLVLFLLCHLYGLSRATERWKIALYVGSFSSFLLVFLIPWLILLITSRFSLLLPPAAVVMGLSILWMGGTVLWEMWRRPKEERAEGREGEEATPSVRIWRGLVVLGMSLLLAGPGRAQSSSVGPITRAWGVMGTLLEVTVYAPNLARAEAALRAAYEAVAQVDRRMSLYRPESELSRLNARAADGPVPVSPELWEVLQHARGTHRLSQGAFDPTVAPLVHLWGLDGEGGELPEARVLARARALVGMEGVELEASQRTVRFLRPGMALDLGGIAKGYAVDRAVRALQAEGIQAGLINLGGHLYGLGHPPGEPQGWLVGIQHPREEAATLGELWLKERAVATSGDYERSFVAEGRRYGHILDPRTGRPVGGMVSVTVQAPSGMEADALSTALFVLGEKTGRGILSQLSGVNVFWVWEEGQTLYGSASPGWRWLSPPGLSWRPQTSGFGP